jgi:TP901 family phage tail tape measure protein|nr:MAG TPA: minor tail protein [Caudoviricetes sp.]
MADGSLIFDTKIDDKGFKKGVAKLKSTGATALKAVGKATVATTAAIATVGIAATKVGSDFEAAMSRVGAISGATGKEFKMLEKTAMELGKTTVFSASEAAEGMQYLAMAGYDANEIVAAMPGVLNAAAAGQVELGTAADITSNVLSGFGLQASETGRVADVLTKAFTSSNTSMESLGETMKYAAPIARAAGFSLEETAAAAGILGDAGIQGSQAGTTLRGVMLRLVNPPKQAAEALDALGVSVVDSNGKMKPLYQIIGELSEATEGMTDAQKTAIISQIAGQNAASGLLAIMDAGPEKIKKFTEELENSGGTAERVANEQIDNLQGDLKLLASVLETVGIKIYKNFNEPLRKVVQTLTEYIETLANTINKQEEVKESLDELGIKAEDVGMSLEEMPSGMSGAVEIIGSMLADMLTKVAEFIPKMLDTGTDLMLSFINGIKNNKEQLIQATLDILQSFVNAFLTVLPEMIVLGIEMLTGFIQGIVEMLPELIAQSQNVIMTIVNAIVENLPLILESGIQIIIMLAQGIAEMMPELITQFIDLVIMLSDTIIENLPMLIEAGLQIILAIAQGLIENLPTLIEHVPRIINAFFDAIMDNLPQILKAGIKLIGMLIKGIIQSIPTLVKNIPAIVRAIVNVIIMYDWAQLGKKAMKWLGDGIASMPGKIAGAARKIAEAGWESIRGKFADAPRLGKDFIKWLIDGIKSMPGKLISAAKDIAIKAFNAVKDKFRDMPGVGKDFVKGIWNGISTLTGWIGSKIAGFAKGLVKKFKDFFKIHSPSKLMEDVIGRNLILGIGVGIEDETPGLNNTVDKEMSSLTKQMKATVDLETAKLGVQISASSNVDRVSRRTVEDDANSKSNQMQGNVYTVIEIDGREVARTITPYTSKELARLTKGRR